MVYFQPILIYMFENLHEYPVREIKNEKGRVLKRYHLWYGENYQQQWELKFLKFFNELLIGQFMPGIYKNQKKTNSDKKSEEAMLLKFREIYFSDREQDQCTSF